MPRLTWPCSSLTPLARWPSRRPMWAMLNFDGVLLGAERQQLLQRHAEAGEVALDERLGEPVDAGRAPGVCVVKTVPARTACSASAKPSAVRLLQLADPLDALEAGVALVGVEHLGLRPVGEPAPGARGLHAADAQQHLLAEAVVLVAAVEPVGDAALGGRVLLDVAVEQQQRHPADLRPPDVRVQRPALGQRHGDDRGGAVVLAHQLHRQAVRVQRRVVLELPPVGRQALREVAAAVQQPDADQRDAEVGRGLEVVAGQDAQAAGVLAAAPR